MTLVLLDTHVLVWLLDSDERLGPLARQMADAAARQDILLVSSITFWDVAMLAQRQRLSLAQPAIRWRRNVLDLGITEIPVSGEIGIHAAELLGFPRDPADRIIAATATLHGATLITADEEILGWEGRLNRHDART